MSFRDSLKYAFRQVRRRLFKTPMRRLMEKLDPEASLRSKAAVELFARSGDWHTIDYASRVASLELWEIGQEFENALRHRFPRAKVRITDTYEELQRTNTKFGLIVSDNPLTVHGGHYEHFDLFPHVIKLAEDDAVMILNIFPRAATLHANFPDALDEEHLAQRRRFYGTDTPTDIPLETIVQTYRDLFAREGFEVVEIQVEPRRVVGFEYLGLRVRRNRAAA